MTGGNIQLSLSINNIPFVNMPLDLCDAAEQAGLNCPLSKGNHSISITEDVPHLAPPVSTIVWINGEILSGDLER